MVEWLNSMSTIEQVFAYIALAGTFALVIQLSLLVWGVSQTGGDADAADTSGLDHDGFDHDGFDHDGFDDAGLDDVDFDDADLDDGPVHDAYCDRDHVHDFHDHDISHHDALRPFTVRSVIAFLAIFGWSGLFLLRQGAHALVATMIGSGLGMAAMVLVAMAFRQMMRLSQSGNLDIRNALEQEATVYLTVPAKRAGNGKVMLLVQERLVELNAVTDSDSPIPTGARVIVSGVQGDTLVVEPHGD